MRQMFRNRNTPTASCYIMSSRKLPGRGDSGAGLQLGEPRFQTCEGRFQGRILRFQFLVQALDGSQGHAVDVERGNAGLVIANLE